MQRSASLPNGLLALVLAALSWAIPSRSQQASAATSLADKSIEDLMNIEVTSASKKAEKLSGAPAAIFVITGDDIRRGGFSSIPDALRLAPGLHVAQQSAHVWIVAARGFSGLFNAQMLVLIDGRLVYTPSFGGVWWDVQDPPLEDIDRIEVIRGPGGALWGDDAINGVINIITKDSTKTQGEQIASSAGVNEGYAARVRYGGTFGENFTYRIYGTSNDWLPSVNATGADNYDSWSISQGGIRSDWNATGKDTITFDGEGYSGRTRDAITVFGPLADPAQLNFSSIMKGGHLLGRWKHTFNNRSATDVLGYCDWTFRGEQNFYEPRNTCDIEIQHTYSLSSRQTLTWGGEVLNTRATEQDTFTTGFQPLLQQNTTYGAFLQYDIELVPDKLRAIAGSKFEHNGYTGFEYQPQIRAVWTPKASHTVWAAASRVIQTPTDADRTIGVRLEELSDTPPTFLEGLGNTQLKAVVAHIFETGYRYEWKEKFTLDGALYYNGYSDLIGLGAPGAPIINPSPLYIDLPASETNLGSGQTHGVELYVKYVPISSWSISTGITALRGNSVAAVAPAAANDPRQQANVQSRLDLARHVNFDAAYYYYDAIPYTLPPVNRVDIGLSWKLLAGFTFSAWGRNLQTERHQEAAAYILPAGELRRAVVFKMIWESGADRSSAKR